MATIVNPILPNILTNGTIADATQVMADFAAIISEINANAAENGSNSSITSLSGLTTPLSVPQGGTGVTAIATYSVLLGNNTGQISSAIPGAANAVLASNGASAFPSFQALSSILTGSDVDTALGFGPVQTGLGPGQNPAVSIQIGWSTASGGGIRMSENGNDQGYVVVSTTNFASGFNIATTFNASGGLFDNGSRAWSTGNYNPLTVNGIGYDCMSSGTSAVEGNTYSLGGRPGTWLCLSSLSWAAAQLYRRIS